MSWRGGSRGAWSGAWFGTASRRGVMVPVAEPQGDSGSSGPAVSQGTAARHYGPTAPVRWQVPARDIAARKKRRAANIGAALSLLLDDGDL